MELLIFVAQCFPVAALILIGGQSLYWITRCQGRGETLPRADLYAIDDLFNAIMMIALSVYALMARAFTGMGLVAALTISGAFLGVRVSRRRGLAGWVVVVAALTWAAVGYRMSHPTGPLCIKLVNNVG